MKATRSKLEILLSFVLCFTMLFSMAVPAFATGTETETESENKCAHTYAEGVCSLCKEPCVHSFTVETGRTEATCTADGVSYFSCVNGCGVNTSETIAAPGHSYDEGTVTTEPGCETKGVKTFTCTAEGCTDNYTEEIAALGHNYVDGTCSVCQAAEETKEPVCTKDESCTLTEGHSEGCPKAQPAEVVCTGAADVADCQAATHTGNCPKAQPAEVVCTGAAEVTDCQAATHIGDCPMKPVILASCECSAKCSSDAVNTGCAVCGAEGADLGTNCKGKKLPAATVTPDATSSIAAGGYTVYNVFAGEGDDTSNTNDRPLQIVLNFAAQETAEQARQNGYGDYLTDFYLTFNGIKEPTNATGCYLAGNYGSFGWWVIPVGNVKIEDGTTYPVVGGVVPNLTYEAICTSVREFIAAIYVSDEFIAANPNMSVSLQLCISKGSETINIGDPYVYTAASLQGKSDVVYNAGDNKYDSLEEAIAQAGTDANTNNVVVSANANAEPVALQNIQAPEVTLILEDTAVLTVSGTVSLANIVGGTVKLVSPASTFSRLLRNISLDSTTTVLTLDEPATVITEEPGKAVSYAVENGKHVYRLVDAVAQIGTTGYGSLADAAAAAQDGDTITLLDNAEGPGLVINKSVTIDFNGKTYSLTVPVGSTGTESNGFQLLSGNNVTIRGGTLKVADGASNEFYILVQNYSNLTVSGMTLDGTGLDRYSGTDGDSYTLSNNSGTVRISDSTIKANDQGDLAYAFDVCDFGSYAAPEVTVNSGNIIGNIEVSEGLADNLVVLGGTYTVDVSGYCEPGYQAVKISDNSWGIKPVVTIDFDDNISYVEGNEPVYSYESNADDLGLTIEGLTHTVNGNVVTADATKVKLLKGTEDVTNQYVVKIVDGTLAAATPAVAKIGDKNFGSVQDALSVAKDGDTVEVLTDATENVTVNKDITLDIADGKNITGTVTAKQAVVTINAADMSRISGGITLENASLEVGDNLIISANANAKADTTGKLTADPADGVAVAVNSIGIVPPNGSNVEISAAGVTSVPAGSTVDFLGSKYSVIAVNAGTVSKDGVLTTTLPEVKDGSGNGVGYGELVIAENDGTKTGVLVPEGETVTVKQNAEGKIEVSTPSGVEDPILDAGADRKGYLTVDPAKKSFYNKSFVSMTFTCNGFIDALKSIEVSSSANKYYKQLTSDECTVTQGSTVAKLKNSYLRSLNLGTYTITFNYKDGQSASATFYVVNTPITGDNNNIAPFIALMAFSVVAMGAVLVLLKKRRA